MRSITYSWILPIKNEVNSLPQLIDEISESMHSKNFEIIAVNDASTDNSAKIIKKLTKEFPQLKIVNFKIHQGKWQAIAAGFRKSKGQIIITLDSDLQDDPRQFPKLLKKLNEGYDLVSGLREERQDLAYKVFISRLGNKLASFLTGRLFKDLNSPYKVYRREVLENLPKHGSLLRFTMIFASELGYKVAEVPVIHRPRLYGKSKFGLVKYVRILYDLILVLLLFSGSGRLRKI